MNEDIIKLVASDLNITTKQVETVLKLLNDGNTIPFIARYRKEATNALDEEVLRKINDVYMYQVNLLKRKEDVIRLIDEKGMLTAEIKTSIFSCSKLVDVEDLYRPYKEKKKTKATIAVNMGLKDLAMDIMKFPTSGSIEQLCKKYLNDEVLDCDMAMEYAGYIISEDISDKATFRKYIRDLITKTGFISTKLKKGAIDVKKTYEMYYDYTEKISKMKSYRYLALNRAEAEKVIIVSFDYDKERVETYLEKNIIKNTNSFVSNYVKYYIKDSLKRLIMPSIIREIRQELKETADVVAIDNFKDNLENLLLTPPIKDKVVMGYDPAFRTGCKLAVLDKTGKVLKIEVIYPTEPHNKIAESKKIVLDLIDKYKIDIIAIGNGTASRESEAFIASIIKEASRKVTYVIVSEAGASVYSASKLAIEEFPDLTVEKRSAISIGRRVEDSLSELVKIDPKSIGVGLYQHDVNEKELTTALDFVVLKAVNSVGVNINTASFFLLKYVSGLNKRVIDAIIKIRDEIGGFKRREDLLKVKAVTPKVYEQAVGFLRIPNGEEFLDKTSIHPESYEVAKKLIALKKLNILDTNDVVSKLKDIDIEKLSLELNVDKYTLEDIIKSLMAPTRDPRDDMPQPILKSDILKIDDLKVDDVLEGTVRNVVDFGIFIDIGLKNDGLAHISKISKSYIKHPKDLYSVGDIVKCAVDSIDKENGKVGLRTVDVN